MKRLDKKQRTWADSIHYRMLARVRTERAHSINRLWHKLLPLCINTLYSKKERVSWLD